jgi:hypothetical protein
MTQSNREIWLEVRPILVCVLYALSLVIAYLLLVSTFGEYKYGERKMAFLNLVLLVIWVVTLDKPCTEPNSEGGVYRIK